MGRLIVSSDEFEKLKKAMKSIQVSIDDEKFCPVSVFVQGTLVPSLNGSAKQVAVIVELDKEEVFHRVGKDFAIVEVRYDGLAGEVYRTYAVGEVFDEYKMPSIQNALSFSLYLFDKIETVSFVEKDGEKYRYISYKLKPIDFI